MKRISNETSLFIHLLCSFGRNVVKMFYSRVANGTMGGQMEDINRWAHCFSPRVFARFFRHRVAYTKQGSGKRVIVECKSNMIEAGEREERTSGK